jgi:hypothetical protein
MYIGVRNYHVVLENGRVRLRKSPRENYHRPAIDVLFRSAAHAYGPKAVGILLTGYMDDGPSGLFAIKARDGVTVRGFGVSAEKSATCRSRKQFPTLNVDSCLVIYTRCQSAFLRQDKTSSNRSSDECELQVVLLTKSFTFEPIIIGIALAECNRKSGGSLWLISLRKPKII